MSKSAMNPFGELSGPCPEQQPLTPSQITFCRAAAAHEYFQRGYRTPPGADFFSVFAMPVLQEAAIGARRPALASGALSRHPFGAAPACLPVHAAAQVRFEYSMLRVQKRELPVRAGWSLSSFRLFLKAGGAVRHAAPLKTAMPQNGPHQTAHLLSPGRSEERIVPLFQ